jgi:uncharacterized protein (UPF0333 family)
MKRGQIGMEYMAIIGLVVVILIPLIYYGMQSTANTSRLNDADTAIKLIKESVERVYSLGPGNKEQIQVKIPSGVSSFITSSNGISLALQISGSNRDFSATTKATLLATNSGSPGTPDATHSGLPQQQGVYTIKIESVESPVSEIGKVKLSY